VPVRGFEPILVVMRLIFSLLLAGVCAANAAERLLGSRQCTYGPSYWCASIGKAKQCAAVDHCISSSWKELKQPQDNDGVCDICKDIVQDARAQLESPDLETQVEQAFDQGCQLIPLADIKKECLKIGSEYVPEMLKLLASELEPQTVCAAAGLCSSHWVDDLLQQHNLTDWRPVKEDAGASKTCSDCRQYLSDVVDVVASHSPQELLDRLLLICSELGSISDSCSALVSVNIQDIYEFIVSDLDPNDLCDMFGMCDRMVGLSAGAPLVERSCAVCERSVYAYSTAYSLQQYIQMLERFCLSTKGFADQCKALVDHFAAASFSHMRSQRFSPRQACRSLGMCEQDGPHKEKPLWTVLVTPEHLSLRPGHIAGRDEANAVSGPAINVDVHVAGQSGMAEGSNEQCLMCQFTLHFIQEQLEKAATRIEIEQAVKNACSYFPKSIREQCDDYIDAYGDQFISILEQEIAPEAICPMLGLCRPPKTGLSSKAPVEEDRPHTLQTDAPCVLCEFAMEKVKQTLEDPGNQKSVRDALEMVCSQLPHAVAKQCRTFVEENTIEIIKLIDAGIEPEQVCSQLGLCASRAVPLLPSKPVIHVRARPGIRTQRRLDAMAPLSAQNQLPIARMTLTRANFSPLQSDMPQQSRECVLCEFVLDTLEKMLLDNNTRIESEIEALLDQVCLLLPSHLMNDCIGLVEEYTRPIVAMIVQGVDAEHVCRNLGLCHNTHLPFEAVLNRVEERMAVDEVIPEPKLSKRIRRSAEYSAEDCIVCQALSKTSVPDFCTSDQFDLEGVDCAKIAAELSSHGSCEVAGVCGVPGALLGSNRCTWGPGFWCAKRTHAHSCGDGAIAHCEKHALFP